MISLVALAWSNLALGGDIFDAADTGDLERVRSLLRINPDLVFSNDYNTGRNVSTGMTPLHRAARYGHKEVAQLLLANGADVNATNGFGRATLGFAAFGGSKEVAAMLLQSNAFVNAKEENGWTPLMIAAVYGHNDVAELLLKNNAGIEPRQNNLGYSPLRVAVDMNNIALVKLLLAYKADVNTRDNNGFTPLACADRPDIAKMLLVNNADVSARDNSGGTALQWAVYRGSKYMVELLIASNVDVNAKDNGGRTPLHTAVERGFRPIVELLLTNKADVNARDNGGNTPLQLGFDNKSIAALLRQHGGHGREISTKPLAGWYLDGDAESQHDKAIIDDYQAYAHSVWPKDHDFFFSEVNFYEDANGRHAVRIELEPGLREYKEYYLIYDTNNVRSKVIKGKTWHQFHM